MQSGAWLAIGIGVGVALGVALDNLALWLALGVAIGSALSVATKDKPGKSDDSKSNGADDPPKDG